MTTEMKYLMNLLQAAGIKTKIFTSMKQMKASSEIRNCAVLKEKDQLSRSGSKKTFVDDTGQRISRVKLFERRIVYNIIIGDANVEKVEEVLLNFLTLLDKGIKDKGNWIPIIVADIDWVDENDSILMSKIAVQFLVTFENGIYKDIQLVKKSIDQVNKEEL